MKNDINDANATFGHVAKIGAPAIVDAFFDVIVKAPQDPEARIGYLEHFASTDAAGRLVSRANARAEAIGEATLAFIGKRYSIDFVEAASAADLLVASDLLVAMLFDRGLASSKNMKIMLGRVFPEIFEQTHEECELSASGDGPEILAIFALRQNGVDAGTSAALGSWHGDLLGLPPAVRQDDGLLADVALLRDALFETYLDREFDIDDRHVSKYALKLCVYAVAIGHTLAGRAAQIRQRRVENLRIVSMPALAHRFLPTMLARFLKERQGVAASLQVQRSETIASWVSTRQFDIGFAMLPMEKPGVAIELFDPAHGVCVMPPGHPLARKDIVTARDLHGLAFVGKGRDSYAHRALQQALDDAKSVPYVRVDTSIAAVACELVASGVGVTVADPFTAKAFASRGLIQRPFKPDVPYNFGVLFPSHSPRPKLVDSFIKFLRGSGSDRANKTRGVLSPPHDMSAENWCE